MAFYFIILIGIWGAALVSAAETFQLPTSNRAIYEQDGEARFFTGTVGKPWTSGTFGCVRSEGWQMHEGIDIACTKRDKSGEPIDDVMATAPSVVAYINTKPSLSNYGNYLVLKHLIDGLEIYSLYAHLSSIRSGLRIGQSVRQGEVVGRMGRTSNTRQRISKDRAHVHFELDVYVNDRFPDWYKKSFPGQRNDHHDWNGRNMIAIDPRAVFLTQKKLGPQFNFKQFLQTQVELFRVVVRDTQFPWLRRYASLVTAPKAAGPIVAYELALNYNGLPFQIIPRTANEVRSGLKYQLISVNPNEYRRHPCRKLIRQAGNTWQIAPAGIQLLDLLTYSQ